MDMAHPRMITYLFMFGYLLNSTRKSAVMFENEDIVHISWR
jgi:hypothetical protein